MKTVWQREIERAAESYADEAKRRRAISKHDPAADTLDYVADDLRERARILGDPTAMRSVEEYAAEHHVSPQTVRNWIHRGELAAKSSARGYEISASAVRQRRVKSVA